MRKINGIKFSRGEMDAIYHALESRVSNLDMTVGIYRQPEWKAARRQWRKQAKDCRSAQHKFWRVSLGLPDDST